MLGDPSLARVFSGIFMLLYVSLMAWVAWTYLEIGTTFFGWLPATWLNISLVQFIGLVIIVQTAKWLLRGLRMAIIGR